MPNQKFTSPVKTYNTEANPLVPFIVSDISGARPQPICVIAASDLEQAKAIFEDDDITTNFGLGETVSIRLPFFQETIMKIGGKTLAEHTVTVKISQRIIDFV